MNQQLKGRRSLIDLLKAVEQEGLFPRQPVSAAGNHHHPALALCAGVGNHFADQLTPVTFILALAHHPQAVNHQVARRVHCPPCVFAGNVFDETNIAPAKLVDDLDSESFGKARFQPLAFLAVTRRFGLAHVTEKAAPVNIGGIHRFDFICLGHVAPLVFHHPNQDTVSVSPAPIDAPAGILRAGRAQPRWRHTPVRCLRRHTDREHGR